MYANADSTPLIVKLEGLDTVSIILIVFTNCMEQAFIILLVEFQFMN